MLAGVASCDITPPLGVALDGYGSRTRGADAVDEALLAHCLVLAESDDPAAAVAILRFDLCNLDISTREAVRRKAASESGLNPERIIVTVSHTHFAPVVDPGPWLAAPMRQLVRADYREQLVRNAAGIVREAWQARRPAKAAYGTHLADGFSFNRRPLAPDGSVRMSLRLDPEPAAVASRDGLELWRAWQGGRIGGPRFGPPRPELDGLRAGVTDPGVAVLRLDAEDGRPLACLVNFACHPVCGGDNLYAISPDYVGPLRSLAESALECPVVFVLGAAGDQVPAWREGASRRRVGQGIAGAAIQAWHKAEPLEGPLFFGTAVAELPIRQFAPLERLRQQLEAHPDKDGPGAVHLRMELGLAMRYGDRQRLTARVWAIGIGDFRLVACPGEVFAEIGLEIKQRLAAPAMVVSLSGERMGYVPTDSAMREGGYEPSFSPLAPGAAAALVDACIRAAGGEAG